MIYLPPILQSDWSECYNHGTKSFTYLPLKFESRSSMSSPRVRHFKSCPLVLLLLVNGLRRNLMRTYAMRYMVLGEGPAMSLQSNYDDR